VSPRARVAIVGAAGRMGRFARALLAERAEFEVCAGIEREHDLSAVLAECRAELGLDLSVAGLGFAHGRILLEHGVRPVIGTSGVTPAEVAELDRLARAHELGGLVVPNFSLGMWCLQRAAALVAPRMAQLAILELHHERKQDAPSGTALDTARRLAAARDEDAGCIPIHSVRLPGMYAHHEVLLGSPGETLALRHDMSGPAAFGPGILCALGYARGALGVRSGLGVALGEE
jgi:4-hydroxy-tetrahydrodipicolinate reductase